MEEFRCARNIHPGEILKDEIEYRKLDKKILSKQIGVEYKILKGILNKKHPITVDIATRIEALMDLPAYVFIEMQKDYDIRALEENKKHAKLLEKLRALGKHVAL